MGLFDQQGLQDQSRFLKTSKRQRPSQQLPMIAVGQFATAYPAQKFRHLLISGNLVSRFNTL